MQDISHCVLCGSSSVSQRSARLSLFVDDRMQGISRARPDQHPGWVHTLLIHCADCDLSHSSRRYSPEEECRYYLDYGHGSYIDQRALYEGPGILQTFLRNLPQDIPRRRQEFSQRFSQLLDLNPRTVIDWGGLGHSVPCLWAGTEYLCRDISGGEPEINWHPDQGQSSADLIISQQVLEHLSNPLEHFREIHRRLSLGGRCYLEVPNESQSYAEVIIHEHVNSWTVTSLCRLVHEFSMTVVQSGTDSVNHWILAQRLN